LSMPMKNATRSHSFRMAIDDEGKNKN